MSNYQGEKLPNGWTIIEVTIREDQWTVLAMEPRRSRDHYAVWSMRPAEMSSTTNGYYTSVLGRAVVEYHRRSNRVAVLEMALGELRAKQRHPSNDTSIKATIGESIPAGSITIFEEMRKRKERG